MKKSHFTLAILGLFTLLISCNSDSENPVIPGEDGFYVVNEGAFLNSNASLSYYDRTTNTLTNSIFQSNNSRGLGDQAQSMTIHDNIGYIVVQGSSKIEIVNPETAASLGTISERINSPRYFLGINSTKAYVSEWGLDGTVGQIKILDLSSLEVVDSIATGSGANKMLLHENKVYVANMGGWGYDNSVKVIDLASNTVASTITLEDNPSSILIDANGTFWVSGIGNLSYLPDYSIDPDNSTTGFLTKMDAEGTIEKTYSLDVLDAGIKHMHLSKDGTTLYYLYDDGIYAHDINNDALPSSPLITGDFYAFNIDVFNGNILAFEAPSFTAEGSLKIYDSEGGLEETKTAGIGPSSAAF